MLAPVHPIARVAVPVIAGYVLGSIPTADLVARRQRVDLRSVGDRNPGWWNARAALGQRAARPVLVGDVAKGAVAALAGRLVSRDGEWWPPVLGGAAAMVGHAWPLFARFRGGRAVATFGGAAGVISPPSAGLALAAGAAAAALQGSMAGGVRAGFVAFPLAQLVVDGPRRTAATGALMSFVGLRFAMAGRASRQ
jgi:glycerol-3-phosphate acyltransferase PlsY